MPRVGLGESLGDCLDPGGLVASVVFLATRVARVPKVSDSTARMSSLELYRLFGFDRPLPAAFKARRAKKKVPVRGVLADPDWDYHIHKLFAREIPVVQVLAPDTTSSSSYSLEDTLEYQSPSESSEAVDARLSGCLHSSSLEDTVEKPASSDSGQ